MGCTVFGSVKYIIGTIVYDYLYWFAMYSPSYTIFVWSGFRSILIGDRLILRGGGGAGKLYRDRLFPAWARKKKLFSGNSMPKYLFTSATKFWKGGGLDWMTWIIQSRVGAGGGGGGGRHVFFLNKEAGQDFPCNL